MDSFDVIADEVLAGLGGPLALAPGPAAWRPAAAGGAGGEGGDGHGLGWRREAAGQPPRLGEARAQARAEAEDDAEAVLDLVESACAEMMMGFGAEVLSTTTTMTTTTTTTTTTRPANSAAAPTTSIKTEPQHAPPSPRPAEPAESQAARDDRNAMACRRSRLKRKADMENLRRRNAELEARRELFLERIAQLQLKVSALRHDNCVDLDKENQLLRAEVRKHRAFINKMVRVVDEAPAMLLEERVRLLTEGIESSVGQVVGLLHTSTSWQAVDPIEIEGGLTARYYTQLLPIGATPETAKRVNLRSEIHHVGVPADVAAEECWRSNQDLDMRCKLEEERVRKAGIRCDVRRFMTPELAEAARMLEDSLDLLQITDMARVAGDDKSDSPNGGDNVEAATAVDSLFENDSPDHGEGGEPMRSQTKSESKLEPDEAGILLRSWIASTRARRKMFPRAFVCAGAPSQELLASLSPEAVECHVVALTELSKDLERAKIIADSREAKQARRPSSPVLSGTAVVPTQDGSACHVIGVWSMPVGVFTGMLTHACEFLNADGTLTENLRTELATWSSLYMRAIAAEARNRSSQTTTE